MKILNRLIIYSHNYNKLKIIVIRIKFNKILNLTIINWLNFLVNIILIKKYIKIKILADQ